MGELKIPVHFPKIFSTHSGKNCVRCETVLRYKNGMDLLYHHAEYGGIWKSHAARTKIYVFFMTALHSRCGHHIFALSFLSFFNLFFLT